MDEMDLEPLEPGEIQVDEINQSKSWIKQTIILGFGALILLIVVGICFYFIFFSSSDELIAQPVDFNITNDPAMVEGTERSLSQKCPPSIMDVGIPLRSPVISMP
jgi:hypothetical protein